MKDFEKWMHTSIIYFFLTIFSIASIMSLFVILAVNFINWEISAELLRTIVVLLFIPVATYKLYKRDTK